MLELDFRCKEFVRNHQERWLVGETKGDQLAGSLDTTYKTDLMNRLTAAYTEQSADLLGELIIKEPAAEYRCMLVTQDKWKATLNTELV